MEIIEKYDYPKQFILREKDSKEIYKTLDGDQETNTIEKYQWHIVSTITEDIVNNEKYTLLQCEDERIGWININESIQIFRFEPEIYRFINEEFENNSINDNLGININFETQFTDKLLTVKSEIEYQDSRLLGIFIKDRFLGFHDAKYFDKLIECSFKIPREKLVGKKFYKNSKMQNLVSDEVLIEEPILVSLFHKSDIGKVKVNDKEYFWLSLENLEEITSQVNIKQDNKDSNQKHIDDLFYGVKNERRQSKEIVKRVLSLRHYLSSKNNKDTLEYDMWDNSELVKEILFFKKENKKLTKELNLENTRLEHQKDYNKRLEAQRNKYKDRMLLLEEKIKKQKK